MTANVHIEKQAGEEGGRYVARVDGRDGEAQLVFHVRGPDLVSADHTEAPESLRGTGAALALIEHMVDDARRSGFKIIPRCPYVQSQLRRHPQWQDVMREAP